MKFIEFTHSETTTGDLLIAIDEISSISETNCYSDGTKTHIRMKDGSQFDTHCSLKEVKRRITETTDV